MTDTKRVEWRRARFEAPPRLERVSVKLDDGNETIALVHAMDDEDEYIWISCDRRLYGVTHWRPIE